MTDYSGQSRHKHAASQHQLHSRHTATHSNKGPKMQQVCSGRFTTRQSSLGRFAGKSSPMRQPSPQKTSSTTPQYGYTGTAYQPGHHLHHIHPQCHTALQVGDSPPKYLLKTVHNHLRVILQRDHKQW